MNNALTIEKLSVSYDNKEALKDISLKIPEHRITAVIGPSGCGKCTFLKCLNGQIMEENARVSGKITLSGTDISKLKPSDLRRKVGLVFQTPAPFPMSIYKNMTYAPRYYGMNDREELKRTVTEKLKLTGLYDEVKDELKKSAVKLSGGQKQRLCIARALTVDPEVLLLDEPCSAARNDDVDVFIQAHHHVDGAVVSDAYKLNSAFRNTGAVGCVCQNGREYFIGSNRFRAAAQDDSIARFQAKTDSVGRNVWTGFVDNAD